MRAAMMTKIPMTERIPRKMITGTERLRPDPEAWPPVAPFSAVSRLLMLKEFMLLELFMYPESLCLAGLWVTWMLSMMEIETRISPCHKMEERKAWF